MEKVRPWCGQPSDRGQLKNRTDANGISQDSEPAVAAWYCQVPGLASDIDTKPKEKSQLQNSSPHLPFPPFLSLLSPSPSLCPFPLSSPPILFLFFSHFSPFPFPITLFTFSSPQNLVRKNRAALLALPDLPLELHKLGLELHI